MKKIFPYVTVKELIQNGGFGTYRLFVLPDNNLVAGSHLMIDPDEDKKMTTDNLIVDLERNIDLMGNGLYRIVLKKTNKSQASTEVIYTFQVSDEGQAMVPQVSGMGIVNPSQIDEMVNQRVTALLTAKMAEMEKQREVDNLRREIEELKKSRRTPPRKKNNDLGAVLNMALVGGSAFIVKQWPETKEIVEKALNSISNGEEEDDDDGNDDGTGFSMPE